MSRAAILHYSDQIAKTRAMLSTAGHFLFFSALFVLNNPYVFLETEIRFGVFLATLTAGTVLIFVYSNTKREIPNILAAILLVTYGVAAVRMKIVGSASGTASSGDQLQAAVTAYTIFMSWIISSRVDFKRMVSSILAVSAFCFLPIFMNAQDLFDYYQKSSFSLGVLTYDAYQAASQIIGFFAISVISLTLSKKRSVLTYVFTTIAAIAALYTVTLSPARGEAIALASAAVVLFISRSKFGYLFLFIVAALVTSQSFFDTTLGSRLSGVASGDLGERDYLFNLALSQFFNSFTTLTIGDGFNGFQLFNRLPLELYPHNFILEGMVSGGIILFSILFSVYILPIIRLFLKRSRDPEESLALAIMVFLVLINLKSGTLVSFWGMGAYTAIFLAMWRPAGAVHRPHARNTQQWSHGTQGRISQATPFAQRPEIHF